MHHVNSTCKIRNIQIRQPLAPYIENQGAAIDLLALIGLTEPW